MNPSSGLNPKGDRRNSLSTTRIKGIWMSLILVILLYAVLFIRLSYIQVFKAAEYSKDAMAQRARPASIDPVRGRILDRNGAELAYSITSNSIYVRPQDLKDSAATAAKLAPILGLDKGKLTQQLAEGQRPSIIAKKVTVEMLQTIASQRITGLSVLQQGQRFYPKGSLAGQVLGFTGTDNQGLEGIEAYYNDLLSGTPGMIQVEKDAKGNAIAGVQEIFTPPVDGLDVILTIDENIQYSCEKHLESAVKEFGGKSGFAIAMEPFTGEILAIAQYPFMNPNEPLKTSNKERRVFPITDQYEPGSTMKTFIAASALEDGIVELNDKFYDPGYIQVADARIKCWKLPGHGEQTMVEAMANSCNPVFSSIALELGAARLTHYFEDFGFGKKTGIDFPGETAGIMHRPENFRLVEQATSAFGQGISVTGIQLLSAMSSIANGGSLMKPYLVKELRDSEGKVVRSYKPTKIRQVLSEQTIKEMQYMMHEVTLLIGSKAIPVGYDIAGKTGTAQKPSGTGGYGSEYIASFIGYIPANDPKIVVLISVDEPQSSNRYGGTISAPVFKAIAADVMRYMGIAPKDEEKKSAASGLKQVPNVIGMTKSQAASAIRKAGLVMAAEGTGAKATEMVPRAGMSASEGSAVVVYFKDEGSGESGNRLDAAVPDLRGKTLKNAAISAGLSGFSLNPQGSGIVYKQEPAPGTRQLKGSQITIWLKQQ